MVKTNRAGSQKSDANDTQAGKQQAQVTLPPATPDVNEKKGKQSNKNQNHRSAVGGTAIQGAKSTQQKETASGGTPTNQQPEYYNREYRRRMQQMGTGPYTERTSADPRERRRKRLERVKERRAEIKRTVDAKGPSRDIKLGRRNTIFLIAVGALLIILIVVSLILRHII